MTIGSLSLTRPPSPTEVAQLRQASLRSVETVDLTFTDSAGRSYELSVERQTSFDAVTYDRSARVTPGGAPPRHGVGGELREGLRELKEDLTELRDDLKDLRKDLSRGLRKDLADELKGIDRSLREVRAEINAFKKMLHRFLKVADSGYADRYRDADPLEAEFARFGDEHYWVFEMAQTVTVRLEVTVWAISKTQ